MNGRSIRDALFFSGLAILALGELRAGGDEPEDLVARSLVIVDADGNELARLGKHGGSGRLLLLESRSDASVEVSAALTSVMTPISRGLIVRGPESSAMAAFGIQKTNFGPIAKVSLGTVALDNRVNLSAEWDSMNLSMQRGNVGRVYIHAGDSRAELGLKSDFYHGLLLRHKPGDKGLFDVDEATLPLEVEGDEMHMAQTRPVLVRRGAWYSRYDPEGEEIPD